MELQFHIHAIGNHGTQPAGVVVACMLIGYLIASFSPSKVFSMRIHGEDVRTLGSGNAGFTNMLRNFGLKAALPVLLIDLCKGWIPVLLVNRFFGMDAAALTGLACVLGHIFPVYYRFSGGKGVATLIGVLLGIHSMLASFYVGMFVLVFLVSSIVSLASVVAVFMLPLHVYWTASVRGFEESAILWTFSLIMPLVIAFTHRQNLYRLKKGTEPKTRLFH